VKKTKAAFLLSCRGLAQQGPIFQWTFTFAEVIAVKIARKRWNHLLTLLLRSWPMLQGIRVFELHKEHGLHVHVLVNRRIDVIAVRKLAEQAGWGRIHVKQIPARQASYVGKDLTKKRARCLRGWRLWAPFGKGWQPVKAKNIVSHSLFSTLYQACKAWQGWTGRSGFPDRMILVRKILFSTIEGGWEPGLGPDCKLYSMCSPEELGLDRWPSS
jgi:hypothetical protein